MLFLSMPSHWLQTYPCYLLEEWRSVLQSMLQLLDLPLCSCTWMAYKNDGYLFLVKLNEEVAKLHFLAFDSELSDDHLENVPESKVGKACSRNPNRNSAFRSLWFLCLSSNWEFGFSTACRRVLKTS